MEEPVTFENKNGKKLFGIVHIPEISPFGENKIGVNLLNPGIRYRVAPHRLNVKLARRLCQNGYYVLRFDPAGIGDSEGELPENVLVHDIWGQIQTGLFVKDTIIANDFFIEKYGLDKLILMGNCGGAITSLLASAEDPRVRALCLVDPPVYLWSSKKSFADTATVGGEKADWFFSEYIKRVASLNSWYRFFTFKTNYRALLKTISIKLQKIFKSSNNNDRFSDKLEALCQEKKLNRLFFNSFEASIQNNRPILFVVAGNDPGRETFQDYFQNGYLKEPCLQNRPCELSDIFLVENANHIYTLSEWQELLFNKVLSWIDTQSQ